MSAVAVQEFLEKIETDESLAHELVKALESEDDRSAVAELATSKGFDVSPEELWAEVQKRQADFDQRQDAGELSDEELEAVAGGEVVVATVTLVAGLLGGAVVGYLVNQIPPIKW